MIIDETGDLGKNGSNYYSMTAVVAFTSRNLLSVSKFVSGKYQEVKYAKSNDYERRKILTKINESGVKIITVIRKKHNQSDDCELFGSRLYRLTISCLIDEALNQVETKDINIVVDSSFFIDINDLKSICVSLCSKHNKNLKKCYKGISQNEPCIRIADFASGAVWAHFEHLNDTYYGIIKNNTTIVELKDRAIVKKLETLSGKKKRH